MAFSGQLGTSSSSLGNIEIGSVFLPNVYGYATADSVSTVTASGLVTRNGYATADSVSTVTASGLVTRKAVATASCKTTITDVATLLTHNATATADSVSTVRAVGGYLRNATTTADSISSVNGNGGKIMHATATADSVSTVSAAGVSVRLTATCVSFTTLGAASLVSRPAVAKAQCKTTLVGSVDLTHNATVLARSKTTISAASEVFSVGTGTARAVSSVTAIGLVNVRDGAATASSTSTITADARLTHKATAKAIGVTTFGALAYSNYQGVALVRSVSRITASSKVTKNATASVQAFSSAAADGQVNVVEAVALVRSVTSASVTGVEVENGIAKASSKTTILASATRTQHGAATAQSVSSARGVQYTAVALANATSVVNASVYTARATANAKGSVSAAGVASHTAIATAKSVSTVRPLFTLIKFLPDYSNTVLWVMADAGVTLDGLGNVSSWVDQSSPGTETAQQASTFARPDYITNQLNGLPVVRFNGTNQFFNVSNSADMIFFQQWTIMAVIRDARTDNLERDIISNVATASLANAIYLATVGTSPTQGRMTDYFGGSNDPNGDTTGVGVLDIAASETGGYFIYTGTVDIHNNPSIYDNDVLAASETHGIPLRVWNNPYTIGRRGSLNQNYWAGDIAELIVWNTSLSYSQIQTSINYLKKKWFGLVTASASRDTTWDTVAPTLVDAGPISVSWNVWKLPTISGNTKWNVSRNPPVTVDTIPQSTQWLVFKHASKTGDTTWDVLHRPIGSVSIGTTWDTLHYPTTDITIDAEWNVEHKITSDAPQTSWNMRRFKTKFHTALWNDRVFVGTTHNTKWNADTFLSKNADTSWNAHSAVSLVAFPRYQEAPKGPERSRWDVLMDAQDSSWVGFAPKVFPNLTIGIQQYVEYDVHHNVVKSDIAIWNVKTHLDVTRQGVFNDRVPVALGPTAVLWKVRSKAIRSKLTQWNVLHLQRLDTTFWNVHTLCHKTAQARWKSIKWNNNGADAIWNVCVPVNKTRQAKWNIHPPGVVKFAAVLWNDRHHIDTTESTLWDIRRAKRMPMTTYWDVLTGKIHCDVPIRRQRIDIRMQVRFNTFGNAGLLKQRIVRWKVRRKIGPTTRTPSWRIKSRLDKFAGVGWRITIFLADSQPTTASWNVHQNPTRTRGVDFNVRHGVFNTSRNARWNVDTNGVSSLDAFGQIGTGWNVQSFASGGAISIGQHTGYMVVSLYPDVGSNVGMHTAWNYHTKAGISASTTWKAVGNLDLTRSTKWDVVSFNNNSSITYWSVKAHVGRSPVVRYNVYVVMGGTLQCETSFNVRKKVGHAAGITWNLQAHANQTANVKWNVIGKRQETATWNVHVLASQSADTTWDVHQTAGTSAGTTWAIGVGNGVGTAWNVKHLASQSADTSWDYHLKSTQSAQTTWDAHRVAEKDAGTTWWYSTVTMGAGTEWGMNVKVAPADPGIATLWMNFPVCSEEFIQAEYRGARDGAILPKITVCELAKEGKKYPTKYDRTRKRKPIQGLK